MNAGTVSIDFITNIARFMGEVAQMNSSVAGFARNVDRYAGQIKAAFGALGVSLGIVGILAFLNHTKDAIAGMKDLADEVGTTAERMSRFEAPTRSAGLALGDTANAMFRLSKAALEARDPASKAAQALDSIGISTKDLKGLKPDEMFELVARRLDNYGDGLQKNAVMQELFSRSGREMNKVVKEIAATMDLHATVTEKEALEAKKFNDQILELKMNWEKFWRSIVSEGIPALNDLLKKLVEAAQAAGLFKTAAIGLAGIFGIDLTNALGAAGMKTNELQNKIFELEQAMKNAPSRAILGANYDAYMKRFSDQIAMLRGQLVQLQGAAAGAVAAVTAPTTPAKPPPNFDPAAVERARAALAAYTSENAELDKQIAKLRGVGELEAYIGKLQEERFKFLSPAQKKALTDKEAELLKLKAEIDARQMILQSATALIGALERLRDIEQGAVDASRDAIDQAQFDITLLGRSATEQEKLNALRAIDLELRRQIAAVGVEDGDFTTAAQNAEIERLRAIAEARKAGIGALIDTKGALTDQLSVWTDLGDRAGQFFSDLVLHGGNAFDKLKQMVKQLLAEMIALFTKRWILNLAAGGSLMGAAGSALAGGPGSDTVAGAGLSLLGSGGNGIAAGIGGASFDIATAFGAGAEAAAAFANVMITAVPVIGLVIAGLAVLYTAFKDTGENWRGQLGFGANANAYTSEGPFGRQGFVSIQGQDATNRALQAFMANTVAIDTIIARTLTSPQIESITNRLAASYTRRNDGQPAQFAFGPDDQTAAAQLSLEFLQHKYGIVFDEIDSAFAKFIRDFTGTAEDLVKFITEEAGVLGALRVLDINGLDIESLRAMQRGGESISQTLTRILTSFAQFDDAFMSDAQKLDRAQQLVTSVFANLGIAVPASKDAFYDLVHGLDLSTESVRHMFDALMAIAPAFLQVQAGAESAAAAVAAAAAAFDEAAGRLNPDYAANTASSALTGSAQAWINLIGSGQTPQEVIADLATHAGDAAWLAGAKEFASHFDGGLATLTALINAYLTANPANGAGASIGGGGFVGGVDNQTGPGGGANTLPNHGLGGGAGGVDNSALIASTQFDLENKLLRATGHEMEAVARERKKELDALTLLDPALADIAKKIFDAEDATAAAAAATKAFEEAAAKAAAVVKEHVSLQERLLQTQGSPEALAQLKQLKRERELADAADQASLALLTQIYMTEDMNEAAAAAAKAIEQAKSALESLHTFQDSVTQSIFSITSKGPGFDAIAYWTGQAATLKASLSSMGGATPENLQVRLETAGKLRDAIMSRYQAEEEALTQRRNAENEAGRAAVDAANRLNAAFRSIGDYAKSMLLSESSPLSPQQQLEEARRQYETAVAGAKAGDVGALGGLQGAADTYLKLRRQFSASGEDFVRDFTDIQATLAALGSRAGPDQVFQEDTARWQNALLDIQQAATDDLSGILDVTNTYQADLLNTMNGLNVRLDTANARLASIETQIKTSGEAGTQVAMAAADDAHDQRDEQLGELRSIGAGFADVVTRR